MKINKKVPIYIHIYMYIYIYALKKAFFTPHPLVMETSRNSEDTGKM